MPAFTRLIFLVDTYPYLIVTLDLFWSQNSHLKVHWLADSVTAVRSIKVLKSIVRRKISVAKSVWEGAAGAATSLGAHLQLTRLVGRTSEWVLPSNHTRIIQFVELCLATPQCEYLQGLHCVALFYWQYITSPVVSSATRVQKCH